MKKFVCMLLVLMVSLCAAAMATEYVPSKTTGDMIQFTIKTESPAVAAAENLVIRPVVSAEVPAEIAADPVAAEKYQEKVEICNTEVKKLAETITESKSVVEYFGEVKTASGETISIQEVLGTEAVNVFEFCPFVVEGYEADLGAVAMTMQFATTYAVDEEIIIMIGLVAEDGTIEWFAFEAIGTEEGVEVEFDAETLIAIQEGTALMAVVSK